jgi:methionyl-tRNA synthetase
MKKFKRYLVTAALPYANGPVHIGHLAGVYVPADIYVRYLRLKGEDVIYVCGSDEHGVPITIKARQEGVKPQDIVDRYHEMNKKAFADFGISFDIYSRTSSAIHYKTASDFFETIYKKGGFIEKTTQQYFDTEANQFLADRYITGTCPHCGNDSAYGDQCEKCGTSLNATDLINPKSMISGSVPVLRDTLHWFLPLDQYEDFLKKWILEENKNWKVNVYGQCKSWIDAGLQPRAVSRDLDWGIPVPVDGAKGKVLYVWFDAPIGYISATKELTPDWEKYWKQEDTKMVHFIGKDNIVFHCIIFPVMLKAEGSFILPDNVPANEFLNLEGDKISTSRNWAVWLHEYLVEFPGKQDVLRYVLCANAPETKDNDYTWKDFQNRNNNELVAILGNFVNRTIVLTHNYFNGIVPAPGELTSYDSETIAEIKVIKDRVENSLENFRLREALKNAMDLARLGNKYLADTEPWKLQKTDTERVKTILNISIQITANITTLTAPFLPDTAIKLENLLNTKPLKWEELGSISHIRPGHNINQAVLLFEKIEDETIDKQLEKLKKTKVTNQELNAPAAAQKEFVSYDEFTKMDIRIGTVLEAEKVPKTKKLLKLTIDTGLDKRTVVSGIAEYFEPQQIIGKQVSILVNLEPRDIKGIQSHGMILLAEDANGKLIFVLPEEKIKPGSIVK